MNEIGELVTVEQAEHVVGVAAAALPVAGVAVGALVGALRRRLASHAAVGLLCGLTGPAVLLLWRVYNAVIGRYGLDSVKALVINLALFAGVGTAAGLAIGFATRRRRAEASQAETSVRHS